MQQKKKGVDLSWKGLSAYIGDKQVLRNVSGYAPSGRTLAIMGPSGAGKTTLLSILSKKQSKGLKVEGEIRANKEPYTSKEFHQFASFVYQNDILDEFLTVREILEFSAKLKISDKETQKQRVEELLVKFSLKKCEDTMIGGTSTKGISGGEKKRVCIAIQLITKPLLLFLDEPTSGLDSFMAHKIIENVNELKKEGKTVVFTIHQPNYKIFSLLDRILLLNRGNCIYDGQSSEIIPYISKLGIEVPFKMNASDFFMLEISEFKARTQNYQTLLNNQAYEKNIRTNVEISIDEMNAVSSVYEEIKAEERKTRSFMLQFMVLLGRQILLGKRNPLKLGKKLIVIIFYSFLFGVLFYQSISNDRPSPQKMYSREEIEEYFAYSQAVSWEVAGCGIYTFIYTVVNLFSVERMIYSKEIFSNTYDPLPYFIAKLFIEIVHIIPCSLIFGVSVFFLYGYSFSIDSVLIILLTVFVASVTGNALGFLIGTLCSSQENISSFQLLVIMPLHLVSGFYSKLADIPSWISWLQYISPFRYGLHCVLLTEYKDEIYVLKDGTLFDYKKEYLIDLSFMQSIEALLAISLAFYILSFIFLKLFLKQLAL